jgi:hypothetical protein
MRSLPTALLLAFALAVVCDSANAQAVRLSPRIQLSQSQFARLQAIANEGPEALRRFLWRTRMIYNWSWTDLVNTDA